MSENHIFYQTTSGAEREMDKRSSSFFSKVRLPHIGQRMIKTTVSVFLCLVIYILRDYRGMIVQSCIAAVLCIQPYASDSRTLAVNRLTGTLIGAFWGLAYLLLMTHVPILNIHMIIVYAIMSLGIMVTLLCCVTLKQTASASLAAIVFLCVVICYPDVERPFMQTLDRLIDTAIGLTVALAINTFHLPREKQNDKLLFIRLQDLVPDRYSHISSSVLIALNRLYLEGATICLVSKWAPAFLTSQMGFIRPTVPLIVMDGAALYDVQEKEYLNLTALPKEDADALCNLLDSMDAGYCVFAVRDNTMIIYRQGNISMPEDMEYNIMKSSPYRNYVDGPYFEEDQIALIRTMDTDVRINILAERLAEFLPRNKYRVVRRTMPGFEGVSGLYFYNPEATVENMKKILLDYVSSDGSPKKPIDVTAPNGGYESERDAIALLHRAKNIYMPVSFKLRKPSPSSASPKTTS